MNRIRRIVALAVLPLWAVVMVHCGLELNGLFGAPVPAEKTSHTGDAAGADTDPEGCGAIENGCFDRHLDSVTAARAAHFVQLALSPLDLTTFDPTQAEVIPPEPAHPPPELARRWSFQRRAAPAPRAPAWLS